jgi:WXG100 family type VII secretion target
LSGQTHVSPQMLTAAATKATQAGEAIALNLTRLLNEIQSQAGGFQGTAGKAFQETSHELGRELRNILSALNTMADNVHHSNRQFGTTDADAGQEIQKVVGEYMPGAGNVANALRG